MAASLRQQVSVLPLHFLLVLALTACANQPTPSSSSAKLAQQGEELPPPSPSPLTVQAPPPTAAPGVLPGNLLIADDVGLGKTVEAGLIAREHGDAVVARAERIVGHRPEHGAVDLSRDSNLRA